MALLLILVIYSQYSSVSDLSRQKLNGTNTSMTKHKWHIKCFQKATSPANQNQFCIFGNGSRIFENHVALLEMMSCHRDFLALEKNIKWIVKHMRRVEQLWCTNKQTFILCTLYHSLLRHHYPIWQFLKPTLSKSILSGRLSTETISSASMMQKQV